MLVRKAWDHVIELKEGFIPKKGKVYSLLREEREKVQAFVDDQLQKGYIRPSKSLQTSPVHFVAKKDGTRLPPYKPIDGKERIPITAHCRHPRWGREKEGVYKVGSEMGLQQCQN